MAEHTWEKSPELAQQLKSRQTQRWFYLVAGIALIAVVVILALQGTIFGSSHFKTVDEIVNDPDMIGKKVRISGAITMKNGRNDFQFDSQTNTLTFTIIHIPNDNDTIREAGGLGTVLAQAVANPEKQTTLKVVYVNNEIPDLMDSDHPTQAILEGKLGEDGIFYATTLLMKCPTKYADEVPDQVASN